MLLADYYNRKIPEYYDTIYQDGYTPEQIMTAFRRKISQEYEAREARKGQRDEEVKKSTDYYNQSNDKKPGSLAAKANMVKLYNEKNNKK